MAQIGSHWTDFHEIYLSIFRRSVENIQVSLKSTRIAGTLHYEVGTFMKCLAECFEREMFQIKIVEKIKIHFMFNNFFPRKSYRL